MSYSISLSSSVPSNLNCRFDPIKTFSSVVNRAFSLSQSNCQIVHIVHITDSLVFRNPRSIPYKIENGYYTLVLSLGGFIVAVAEKSYDDMVEDLKDQIKDAWDYYACEGDGNLTKGAQQVKQWLRRYVVEV